MSIVAPTITVFLPRSLRKRFERDSDADLLVGWCFAGGPTDDKVFVVVAGLISPGHAAKTHVEVAQNVMKTATPACIVGRCNLDSRARYTKTKKERGEVWIEVVLTDGQSRTSKGSDRPEIASLRGPIICNSTAQCAINVVLYTIPRANRMKYLSLEPMVLPAASTAGVLDRLSEASDSQSRRKLESRLEKLIRLDPLRHQELATDHPSGRAPGEGFRKAMLLVSYSDHIKRC